MHKSILQYIPGKQAMFLIYVITVMVQYYTMVMVLKHSLLTPLPTARWRKWSWTNLFSGLFVNLFEGRVQKKVFAVAVLRKDSVFENSRFGNCSHLRLAVLVGVLDFERPTKQFC